MTRPHTRVRNPLADTRPPFETQYEKDLRAIESADRFRKFCLILALLVGLGAAAFTWWLWL